MFVHDVIFQFTEGKMSIGGLLSDQNMSWMLNVQQ